MQHTYHSKCIFDREVALKSFGHNEDGLREALRKSWPEAQRMVSQLRVAAASHDVEGFRQAVHWLRAGMLYIGALQADGAVNVVASDFSKGRSVEASLMSLEESLQTLLSALRQEELI